MLFTLIKNLNSSIKEEYLVFTKINQLGNNI